MPDAESSAGNDAVNCIEMIVVSDCPKSLQTFVADLVACLEQFIELVNEDNDLLLSHNIFAKYFEKITRRPDVFDRIVALKGIA